MILKEDSDMPLFGGIEGGGTKFVCAIGTGPDDIRAETRFDTELPDVTLAQVEAFFREQRQLGPLAAVGIASFGPIDPDSMSPDFGHVTTTPKPGWAHTDFAGTVHRMLGVPVGFDTDVNVAALGEHRWGAARGLDTFIYLTVGTGIGGGGMVNGKLIHGMMHPEMGHIRIPHDRVLDPYTGNCPYHGDCFEGLCCGPALAERWGMSAAELPAVHPAWGLEAHYLALGIVNYLLTISPQRIILGGGVMHQSQLFPMVRAKVKDLLNGYIRVDRVGVHIDEYIVPPGLGDRAGVLGAIALAEAAYSGSAPAVGNRT
jgi:fructokinase